VVALSSPPPIESQKVFVATADTAATAGPADDPALPAPAITSCAGTVSFGSAVPAGWFLTIEPGGDPELLTRGPFDPLPRTFAPGTYAYMWHAAQDPNDPARTDVHLGGGTFTVTSCGDPVLIGAGDICHSGMTQAPETAALIQARPNDLVFTAGDNDNQDGSQTEYDGCVAPNWGTFKSRTFPAPGNHDYDTTGAVPYYKFYPQARGTGEGYYYYYLQNNWMVIVLNANCEAVAGGCGSGSPEETWLRWNLSANPGKDIIAIWHQPEFSSGAAHGSDDTYLSWWQDLYAAHASIVMNGHDHDYERFAPQSPDGHADPNGIREFVVGTGGADQYAWGSPQANSEVRCPIGTYGVLELTLHAGSYDWHYIPTADSETCVDSGTQSTPSGF
jgi:acid phosphatase type 7